jgi:hypothetical protein
VQDFAVLMAELIRIRQEFEIKNRRAPTAEEVRILQLAEQLLQQRQKGGLGRVMLSRSSANITLFINGIIREAECPSCRDSLQVSDLGGTMDEQVARLQAIFDEHSRRRHPELWTRPA